jgi:hypothetical protein
LGSTITRRQGQEEEDKDKKTGARRQGKPEIRGKRRETGNTKPETRNTNTKSGGHARKKRKTGGTGKRENEKKKRGKTGKTEKTGKQGRKNGLLCWVFFAYLFTSALKSAVLLVNVQFAATNRALSRK